VNSRLAGAYVDFSENAAGLLGQLRLSFYPNIDFGFQGGLSRLDTGSSTKTTLRLGGDVRFGAGKVLTGFPLDLAIGAGLGVETGDEYTVLRFGPSVVASRALGNSPLTAYAGAMLCFASVDIADNNETDFSVPLRLGAELRAIPGVRVSAEIQLAVGDDFQDDVAFAAGVNLPF